MRDNDLAGEGSQIGERLRRARRDADLTQGEAAKLLGVNPMTISKRERGERGISAADFEAAIAVYKANSKKDGKKLGLTVPRGTVGSVREEGAKYGPDDAWSPNPALKNKIPARAYETAVEYCRRLQRAGVARENIEEAERLMIDARYAQANKRHGRELNEDEWIMLVDATWEAIRETLSWEGVRV